VPILDRDDSVLVVVDVQPGFLKKVDSDVALDVVDRIRWLVTLANALDIPVRVTEEEPEHNGETAEQIRGALRSDVVRHTKPTFGLTGTPEIFDDVASPGRRTAVVAGLETDVCVAQTALGLADAGWRAAVVVDAIASPGTSHEQGMSRMRDAGIELIGAKAVAYDWLGSVALANEILSRDGLAAPRGVIL